MNNIKSKIIGIIVLVFAYVFIFLSAYSNLEIFNSVNPNFLDPRTIIFILLLGVSYSLLHQKNYPTQAVLSVLIVEMLVYLMKHSYSVEIEIITLNFLVAPFLVIGGNYTEKFFRFILSPIQNFLASIGLNFTIPVIAGILFFPICLIYVELYVLGQGFKF